MESCTHPWQRQGLPLGRQVAKEHSTSCGEAHLCHLTEASLDAPGHEFLCCILLFQPPHGPQGCFLR